MSVRRQVDAIVNATYIKQENKWELINELYYKYKNDKDVSVDDIQYLLLKRDSFDTPIYNTRDIEMPWIFTVDSDYVRMQMYEQFYKTSLVRE